MELQIIKQKIHEIRGQRVMLDFDLAELFQVLTKALNQAVKRNIGRFPEDFMFQLNLEEWQDLKSQIVISGSDTANWSQIVTSSKKHRGEELGLTEGEVAFYDALETNDSAVAILGDAVLKQIALDLYQSFRENATIDWSVKESVRAKLRSSIKRVLR